MKFETYEEKTFSTYNEFILVCDCSGSMGSHANSIISKVMPKVFEKLKYQSDKIVNLIVFNDDTQQYRMKVADFKNSTLTGDGCTYMAKVPMELEKIINSYSSDNGINILTISDGLIFDQDETKNNAEKLCKNLKEKYPNINSQAIRYKSSNEANPDTKALCSLLDFCNPNFYQTEGRHLEVTYNPNGYLDEKKIEELSEIIADLFNKAISGWKIVCKEKRLYVEPYGPKFSSIQLPTGKHLVFYDGVFDDMNDLPKIVDPNGKVQTLSKGEEVSQDNYRTIYEDNIKQMIKKICVKKTVGTKEAEKSIDQDINFLKEIEKVTPGIKNNNSKPISEVLEEIKNDDKIKGLSGDELNNYINEKNKKCEEKIDEIVKEEKKIRLKQYKQNSQFLVLIDSSRYMINNINNLIQNIIYNVCLKLGFNEKDKIRIFGFNSKDVDECNIQIRKLPNHEISCEGERKLYDALNTAGEIMLKSPDINYFLFTLISGEIKDKDNLRILAFKMLGLGQKVKIISRVVKFVNSKSDFPKNRKGIIDESKEDLITYGLIRQLDTLGMTSVKPLVINESDSDYETITKIVENF